MLVGAANRLLSCYKTQLLLAKSSTAAVMSRPSSDMAEFRRHLQKAKRVAVLTGAGVSAESGVPTFRGAGGLWRQFSAPDLASPNAFARDPSLVWEFYHYRREVMASKRPNAAHTAIAEFEHRLAAEGRRVAVITQNIDELHQRAGSCNVIEIHGSLFRTSCTKCGVEEANKDSPICEGLRGCGAPERGAASANIDIEDLPACKCGRKGLLRPAVLWFGEAMKSALMDAAMAEVDQCDVCLVVGTSSVVYPAALFAPEAARRGAVVAEFNIEDTPVTNKFAFHFDGPCGRTLPVALAP